MILGFGVAGWGRIANVPAARGLSSGMDSWASAAEVPWRLVCPVQRVVAHYY